MIIKDPELQKQIKAGIANPVEIERWLLNNCSAPNLAHELAGYIVHEEASKPIILSLDEFRTHFRIAGFRWIDGKMEPDGRGQGRWKK